ncbi:MAG TPA: hypothetical protein VFR48_02310 [Solirubrobacteraceae bacterium]|nr:hypothetical protein [Solirubrobacteraceae bacterium]
MSLTRHLGRGALGFGLIACALVLSTRSGGFSLLLAPAGLLALRGCPMCWTLGLIETFSAGHVSSDCDGERCSLARHR